jgi:hypothetical protein
MLTLLTGWLDRHERDVVRYLLEENRVLRRQLRGRLQLTDSDRRRLAVRAYLLGRKRLREFATVVTPDTLLRWHRQLITRKWTFARRGASRGGVLSEIRRLTVRMAEENPTWGYTRIQGALKNVGHRVGRSTIARILKAAGIPPQPERATSWRTFLRAHWGTIAGADFFTNGGVDVARTCDVLHRICHRPGVTTRAHSRIDALSRRDVYAAGRSHAADGG